MLPALCCPLQGLLLLNDTGDGLSVLSDSGQKVHSWQRKFAGGRVMLLPGRQRDLEGLEKGTAIYSYSVNFILVKNIFLMVYLQQYLIDH